MLIKYRRPQFNWELFFAGVVSLRALRLGVNFFLLIEHPKAN
jgi:hypothetical protein